MKLGNPNRGLKATSEYPVKAYGPALKYPNAVYSDGPNANDLLLHKIRH